MQSHSLFIHEDSLPALPAPLHGSGQEASVLHMWTSAQDCWWWGGGFPRRSQGCHPITSALVTLPDPGTTSGRTIHQYEDRRQHWGPAWTLATMAAFLADPEKSVLPGVPSWHPPPLNLQTHPWQRGTPLQLHLNFKVIQVCVSSQVPSQSLQLVHSLPVCMRA